jgi:hypothetical protein
MTSFGRNNSFGAAGADVGQGSHNINLQVRVCVCMCVCVRLSLFLSPSRTQTYTHTHTHTNHHHDCSYFPDCDCRRWRDCKRQCTEALNLSWERVDSRRRCVCLCIYTCMYVLLSHSLFFLSFLLACTLILSHPTAIISAPASPGACRGAGAAGAHKEGRGR